MSYFGLDNVEPIEIADETNAVLALSSENMVVLGSGFERIIHVGSIEDSVERRLLSWENLQSCRFQFYTEHHDHDWNCNFRVGIMSKPLPGPMD